MVRMNPIPYLLFMSIPPMKNRRGWFIEEIFGLKKGYIHINIEFLCKGIITMISFRMRTIARKGTTNNTWMQLGSLVLQNMYKYNTTKYLWRYMEC
jgi:hypothetical protein